jgi:hypothetical protein
MYSPAAARRGKRPSFPVVTRAASRADPADSMTRWSQSDIRRAADAMRRSRRSDRATPRSPTRASRGAHRRPSSPNVVERLSTGTAQARRRHGGWAITRRGRRSGGWRRARARPEPPRLPRSGHCTRTCPRRPTRWRYCARSGPCPQADHPTSRSAANCGTRIFPVQAPPGPDPSTGSEALGA